MLKVFLYATVGVAVLHGLIHLLGFVAYWPLAALPELPYKTALLGGHWEVGRTGMRVYALLWLTATLVFLLAAAGLVTGQGWWHLVMLGAVIFSMVLIGLDWTAAYRGAIVNVIILAVWILTVRLPGLTLRP